LTGSSSYSAHLQAEKDEAGIIRIEIVIPTSKTASALKYDLYINHVFQNYLALFSFYGYQRSEEKFSLYQGRQQAPQMMVNYLVNGDKKYDRKKRRKRKKKQRMKRSKGKEKVVNVQVKR
jgi:hypothetical protein